MKSSLSKHWGFIIRFYEGSKLQNKKSFSQNGSSDSQPNGKLAKEIQNITSENFSKYGVVIDLTLRSADGWEILVKVEQAGWRIAVLEFSRKSVKTLECHPSSRESFEPMSGTALLILAPNENPGDYEAYLLDRPVCLNEGIWHQIISFSEISKVKITENLEVESEYYELKGELKPVLLFN